MSTLRQTNLLISYVQDFSRQAVNVKNSLTEESLVLLNRSVSLLCAAKHTQDFVPASLEMTKFFIDLHSVIDILSPDTDVLWACLNVVQHASQNLQARHAIVNEFRFVPLLTNVLRKTVAQDKIQRLLTLLQDLTYGIEISWEEPYLSVLIEILIKFIYGDDEPLALLALSILINLCYRNFTVICLLLRTLNISSFSKRIISYGVLASKMLIILSEDIKPPGVGELHNFIKANFVAIEECAKTWNVPYLKHIVEFLKDSETHKALHLALRSYETFSEDIERLLECLERRLEMDDSTDETRKNQHLCMGLIFQLLNHIFQLGEEPAVANGSRDSSSSHKSDVKICSNVPAIYELIAHWIDSEWAGVEAINLLEVMVRFDEKDSLTKRIAKDSKIVTQLIAISENNDESSERTTAILKLVFTLLNSSKTEKLILSKITESYFDKIFAPLISTKPEMLGCSTFALEDISKYVFCLLVLIGFSNIAKKAYFEKVVSLLQMQQFQFVLAKAMLSGSEQVAEAIFEISKFEYFPQKEVAKIISQLSALIAPKNSAKAPYDQWPNLNAILKSNQTNVSKEIEERLDALLNSIYKANHNSDLNNVATSQLIELYNHKINMLKSSECNMNKKLDTASQEITSLCQQVSLQKAELEQYHTMNFKLHITQERLQTECKDLTQQRDNLRKSVTTMMKNLEEQNESLKINEKRLEVKTSEMIVLRKEYADVRKELEKNSAELERLQGTSKEYASRIDKLKKTIDAYEHEIKEKKRSLDETQKEATKATKLIEDLKESLSKSESVVKLLEQQIGEKNETIRTLESELTETEEMRKTIMSLMESKSRKRKA